MAFIEDLARAIARQEGYLDAAGNVRLSTRAAVNNNPGNLRAGPRAIGKDLAGYAVYRSVADGWADLYGQVGLDMGRGYTLTQFLNKYAPASENPTSSYISNVSTWLSIPADVPLRDLAGGAAVGIPSPALDFYSNQAGSEFWPEAKTTWGESVAALTEDPMLFGVLVFGGAAFLYLLVSD